MKVSHGLLAGVMLTLAIPVCAQSLADLAKAEQERRKAAPVAGKTYTDDDLKKIYVPPVAPAPAADASAKPGEAKAGDATKPGTTKPDAAKPAEEPADPAKDQSVWRARMDAARAAVVSNEMFRDALQSQINGLTNDFYARDDPAQRAQIGDARQKAIDQLAKVNADIVKANQAVADVEEAARKAGVPPGWIR